MLFDAGLFIFIFVNAGPGGTARNIFFTIGNRIGEVQWGKKGNF
jgi:hypothetical protein